MGLYDFKARISLDTKDDDSVRELIVQKYEKKRFYVDPSNVRHTVEPEPEKLANGPLHSPPSKFSSGLIGSTLQMHKNSPPPASAAIAKPSPTATPPPIKMATPAASSERASTSSSSSFGLTSPPLAAASSSLSLSKPSPFSKLNAAPVRQNTDPFGVIAPPPPSTSTSSAAAAAAANDFFSKNDSFANFDTANIYSSSTSNQLPSSTMPQPAAQIVDFGFPPMPTAPVPVAVAPAQPKPEAKKPVMAAHGEDKYAALKDLDNIFKSSFELTAKPVTGDAEPFPPPQKHVSVPASNRTYNPFAAEYSASPQPNTSPWPTTGSPAGPGFGAASSSSSKIPDFFPSPWDTPAAAPTSNQGDFFGGKNFSNPWSEGNDNDKFSAFGFNKKNPFL